jgi:hypothetical protein
MDKMRLTMPFGAVVSDTTCEKVAASTRPKRRLLQPPPATQPALGMSEI